MNLDVQDSEMDAHEIMAWDLEAGQNKRYSESKLGDEFWSELEMTIFYTIQAYRNLSKTFSPMKAR